MRPEGQQMNQPWSNEDVLSKLGWQSRKLSSMDQQLGAQAYRPESLQMGPQRPEEQQMDQQPGTQAYEQPGTQAYEQPEMPPPKRRRRGQRTQRTQEEQARIEQMGLETLRNQPQGEPPKPTSREEAQRLRAID